ncbi:uncharacterized protein LOC132546169 [Ylistrum balloti]|uniref:uncharacterized protein LOC132546169 n=1 Tax=Ylistrum balloti TaxID=509963 RepID=UPI002905EB68|nr:uncharacterized protein LOC132546169 [Ylistrum balloti]
MASATVVNHFTTPRTNSMSSARLTNTPITNTLPLSRMTNRTSSMMDIVNVDDDITHTVANLLDVNRDIEDYEELVENVGKTLQAERNLWKQRLNAAMQEIDRQHKIILSHGAMMQELQSLLYIEPPKNSKPEQILEDEVLEDTQSSDAVMQDLKSKIKHLKQLAGVTDDILPKDPKDKMAKYSELDFKYLKNAIANLHWEKDSLQSKIDERDNEILWLKGELQNTTAQLTKMQDIVTSYNASHAGIGFHLENMESDDVSEIEKSSRQTSKQQTSKCTPSTKERRYVEGDQILSYPVGKEEVAFWKTRLKANVYSNKGGNSRTGVAQCLRCNRLFKPSDNNSKACMFHSKGREIKEIYGDNGKILNVNYKWACCKKGLESKGCSHGFHI